MTPLPRVASAVTPAASVKPSTNGTAINEKGAGQYCIVEKTAPTERAASAETRILKIDGRQKDSIRGTSMESDRFVEKCS